MQVHVDWAGLIGGLPGAAHIHCCTDQGTNVGVAVPFVNFPNTLSGTYDHTFDLLDASIYTMAFLNNFGGGTAAGAEAALIAGMDAGRAYSNIHNDVFPGGEMRGFLEPVPEPSAISLLASGVGLLGLYRRRLSSADQALATSWSHPCLTSWNKDGHCRPGGMTYLVRESHRSRVSPRQTLCTQCKFSG